MWSYRRMGRPPGVGLRVVLHGAWRGFRLDPFGTGAASELEGVGQAALLRFVCILCNTSPDAKIRKRWLDCSVTKYNCDLGFRRRTVLQVKKVRTVEDMNEDAVGKTSWLKGGCNRASPLHHVHACRHALL
jgi:hypothetical protein